MPGVKFPDAPEELPGLLETEIRLLTPDVKFPDAPEDLLGLIETVVLLACGVEKRGILNKNE